MAWNNRQIGWSTQVTPRATVGFTNPRFNEMCTLVEKTYEVDIEGVPQPTETRRKVFCGAQTVGAHTWSSMYEIGISADAQIAVRTCDYKEERDVLFRDKWYSVEIAQEKGDFTVLTLRHQKSDAPEFGESGEFAESGEVNVDEPQAISA